MDRLISLNPSNVVAIRVEVGEKCYGELTLRNVMYTMPVAFRLQPMDMTRYTVRPQSGIISPLSTLTVEITYALPPNSVLPYSFPYSEDSFLLHSVVAPGAVIKDSSSNDSVPNDWFTTRKKQVFIDSGIKVIFVGSMVLAKLVADGSMDEVREVLDKSQPTWCAVDSVDDHGQTLLHLAIAQSRADLVQLLLEFKPDVEARSRSGKSPLETASAVGDSLIVELLLAHRASTERSDSSTWGPLHLAARGGHVEVMRLLLLKGANVDALTEDGQTALHLAVKERRRDCARLLLAGGARVDVPSTGEGDTPLYLASGLGDEHMVKLLLQKGANKDTRNKHGKTAYDVAAENGNSRLFDALKLGDSLCTAARKGEVRTIHRLLDKGASINGKDEHGWTLLHRAAFKGWTEAVQALIEKGVEIDAKDEEGYTALHCAAESGQAEVTELLVKKGANVEAWTNKGVTPLQMAELLGYSGITRILVQRGATKETTVPTLVSYGSSIDTRDSGTNTAKRKPSRKRAIQRSFDQSIPLAVL
ncbi:hypothetical protein GIB67_031301 [Kingdonia uniflora]|uniref:MSP domain-containing protein n=1 Tax=Kingdonia uniflora TaxID=39325 RepID=A0A7J7P5P6_9MAGN|nr:hypothetical protein GIB67_031301 [Kingdonia uniflora]